MRTSAALAFAVLTLASCRGSVPAHDRPPERGISAVLIGTRMLLPTGESKDGRMAINLESEGGRRAEVYRLPLKAAQNSFYLVEPGAYRLYPTRSIFGSHQEIFKFTIDGRTYRLPFPREILRLPEYTLKPTKILALGVLEAKVEKALPGQAPSLRVRLDDSAEARRKVVQDTIRDMMDPSRPFDARESAIGWSRQLQNALLEITSEDEKRALYKPGR